MHISPSMIKLASASCALICSLGMGTVALAATNDIARPEHSQEVTHLYNPYTHEHFYSSDAEEVKNLVSLGWQNHGRAWYAPEKDAAGAARVYRLFNPYNDDHHYTSSMEEVKACVEAGWQFEENVEIWGFASSDAPSGEASQAPRTGVQRLFNPYAERSTHYFTANQEDAAKNVALGWKYESTSWYVYSAGQPEKEKAQDDAGGAVLGMLGGGGAAVVPGAAGAGAADAGAGNPGAAGGTADTTPQAPGVAPGNTQDQAGAVPGNTGDQAGKAPGAGADSGQQPAPGAADNSAQNGGDSQAQNPSSDQKNAHGQDNAAGQDNAHQAPQNNAQTPADTLNKLSKQELQAEKGRLEKSSAKITMIKSLNSQFLSSTDSSQNSGDDAFAKNLDALTKAAQSLVDAEVALKDANDLNKAELEGKRAEAKKNFDEAKARVSENPAYKTATTDSLRKGGENIKNEAKLKEVLNEYTGFVNELDKLKATLNKEGTTLDATLKKLAASNTASNLFTRSTHPLALYKSESKGSEFQADQADDAVIKRMKKAYEARKLIAATLNEWLKDAPNEQTIHSYVMRLTILQLS